MAQRRMFSLQIVDTDAFIDMPQSSQLLYFHLAMRADDEGFVSNPKKVMKMIGIQDDDFKILIAKRFILSFESGVVVIKHWKIHNYIQSDRFKETAYLEEKKGLTVKENGAYTECIQDVSKVDTQVRLGKDRLGKVRIIEQPAVADTEQIEVNKIMDTFYKINPTLNYGNKSERKSSARLIKKLGLEKAIRSAEAAVAVYGKKFAPTITKPSQLENKLSELVGYYKKEEPKKIQSL
jgi:hypothetical protein